MICHTCKLYSDCKRWGLLARGNTCHDYIGKIIIKGLLYRCTCGFTDMIEEAEKGKLICTNCGAIGQMGGVKK